MAVASAATLYTALANPYVAGYFPPCVYLELTGHWCPGCGGLRAVHELARGDLLASLSLNPLVLFVVVPFGFALLGSWFAAARRGRSAPRIPMWVAIGIPALFLVFGVARNIPVLEPYLAP